MTKMDPRTVLIVDDSPAIRAGLRRILEPAGYRIVAEAADGSEGVARYAELAPDLVTMDVEMRPMDGLTALKNIRTYDPSARVIVITSAYRQAEVLEALALGAGFVLRKPPKADKLLEAARRLLARPSGSNAARGSSHD
ncbi:MAG: response regulator [Candidatus Wallbacteria bacterium]|nr:response regulator [Candidatus Wallbacteria bacterium]